MIPIPDFTITHPLAMLVITIALTLLGKFLWDRYMSQASRVTRREFEAEMKKHFELCTITRQNCNTLRDQHRDRVAEEIQNQTVRIDNSEEESKVLMRRRLDTRRVMVTILITQQKICDHLKIDCGDINKTLIDMGLVE